MENDSFLSISLVIIGLILVGIFGGIYLSANHTKCVSSCTSEPCRIGRCSFEFTKFKCNKNPIANCCGNGMCEKDENQCNCGRDCVTCAGIAGLCEEYTCNSNETCVTTKLRNCCGNGICEISEDYNKCSKDCTVINTAKIISYDGPESFNQENCNGLEFDKCDEGHYKILYKNEILIIGFQLPKVDFSKETIKANFSVYAKNAPNVDDYSLVSVYVNDKYVGDIELKPSYWDRADFGFNWYIKKFPMSYLKPGYNSIKLEPAEWAAIARYEGNPMSYIGWSK